MASSDEDELAQLRASRASTSGRSTARLVRFNWEVHAALSIAALELLSTTVYIPEELVNRMDQSTLARTGVLYRKLLGCLQLFSFNFRYFVFDTEPYFVSNRDSEIVNTIVEAYLLIPNHYKLVYGSLL
jgi:hypothetical protein